MPSFLTAPVVVTIPTDETPPPMSFRVSGESFDRIQITATGMYVGTGSAAPTLATDSASGAQTVAGTLTANGQVVIADAKNIAVGTVTGTVIGTTTSQKIGFFNTTPVIQPTGTTDILTALTNLGLVASGTHPLNIGTGALTAGASTLAATTVTSLGTAGNVTLAAGNNFILDATTGTKIGTATTQKLGFFNATPVVQQTAMTQTYATADPTLATLTAATLTDSTAGTPALTLPALANGTVYATDVAAIRNNLASLGAMVNKNTADHADLAQFVNSLVDSIQALGLVG